MNLLTKDINLERFQYMCTSPFQLMRSKAVSVSFFPLCSSSSLLLPEIIFSSPSRSPVFCVLHADARSVFTPCLFANVYEKTAEFSICSTYGSSIFFRSHWPPNFSLSGDRWGTRSLILFGPKSSKMKAACQALKNCLTLFVIQALWCLISMKR